MGSPGSHARPSFTRRLHTAAAPALIGPVLVGTVAAVAMTHGTASAATDTPGEQQTTAATVATVAEVKSMASATPDGLLSVSRHTVAKSAAEYQARHRQTVSRTYTVKPGDSLSSVAQRVYGGSRYWTVLYWANHKHVKYANELTVGEVLSVPAKPAKIPAAPKTMGPAAPVAAPTTDTAQTGGTYTAPASTAPASTAPVSTGGDSSFQACVIERESGGNPQVWNPSGHWGLYQFSESTWVAYGGSAADFGSAGVAEQNQVFENAIAAGGASNWSAYDGC